MVLLAEVPRLELSCWLQEVLVALRLGHTLEVPGVL
jgi:hypothetical protein